MPHFSQVMLNLWLTVYFICYTRNIRFFLQFEELISCLGHANVRAFHENPNRIHTELTFIKNSEYDQEIPQSQTADKPIAPRGRATQQSRDTRKTY